MTTQINLIELVDYLKTSRRASLFLSQVDEMSELIYTSQSVDFLITLETKYDSSMSKFMTAFLSAHKINTKDIQSLKSFFQDLKTTVKQLHQVKMLLAMEPNAAFVDKLHLWAKQNISEIILLNIEINPAILGGVIVIYKGIYRDISLAPQIDTYFKEKRSDVQKLFS